MTFIIIKVTYPDEEKSREAINHLLENKLISSANAFPIKSTSSWTGKIEEVDEILVLLKTKKENWEKVRGEVKKIHPYKIPCIIKLDVESNEDYEKWVNDSCQ